MIPNPPSKWEVYIRDMASPMYVTADRVSIDGNFSFVLDGRIMLLVAGADLVYMMRGAPE